MLTATRLRELLHYDPNTGVFTRIVTARAKRKVGRLMTARSGGKYLQIGVDYERYLAHRLAFLYMTNEWPKGDVDHRNGDSLDNRWGNLREATRSQNNINRLKLDNRNSSGHTGVRWHEGMQRWQAICSFTFRTKEEAVEARRRVVEMLAGDFAPRRNGG